ncbi:hypothetical protein [Bradyrhizobium genosp. P]|uniref:hypothetical protein n=1 Tax=Bradyrhizobium genosp. P TaxID=83641 RepID=UPI003CEB5B21
MPEARDLRPAHVAADHPFGQARLERLIDDAAAPSEIRLAAGDEGVEWNLLGLAAALGVEHPEHRIRIRQGFHLPDTLASIPAVLLKYAWAVRTKARREFGAEGIDAVVSHEGTTIHFRHGNSSPLGSFSFASQRLKARWPSLRYLHETQIVCMQYIKSQSSLM